MAMQTITGGSKKSKARKQRYLSTWSFEFTPVDTNYWVSKADFNFK